MDSLARAHFADAKHLTSSSHLIFLDNLSTTINTKSCFVPKGTFASNMNDSLPKSSEIREIN